MKKEKRGGLDNMAEIAKLFRPFENVPKVIPPFETCNNRGYSGFVNRF